MSYNGQGEPIVGRVVSAEEEGMLQGRGGNYKQLLALIDNPGKLQSLFALTPEQARNTKALITGMGTAAAVRYLGDKFGDELSAIMGAAVSAYLSKKLFG